MCGTVLIKFFSAHSVFPLVFLTSCIKNCKEALHVMRIMTSCVVFFNKKNSVTFESEAEPQLFVACS